MKRDTCKIGDLVHIPQATELVECQSTMLDDPQLVIPLRLRETTRPEVGIVTHVSRSGGYIKVYCVGEQWSVKNSSVYLLNGEIQ